MRHARKGWFACDRSAHSTGEGGWLVVVVGLKSLEILKIEIGSAFARERGGIDRKRIS